MFAQNSTLFAFPFDLAHLKRLAAPVPLSVEDLSRSAVTDTAQYAISHNGTLVQIPGAGLTSLARTLVWVDRNGTRERIGVPADTYSMARISPDGKQAAVVIGTPGEIWILNLETGTPRNLTLSPDSNDTYPVWTPDSRRILFHSERKTGNGVYGIPAEGGQAEFVAGSDKFQAIPWAMIDAQTLAVVTVYNSASVGVTSLRLDGSGKFEVRLPPDPIESEPALSPKGNWLAYQWIRPDVGNGVYFRPFPEVDRAVIPGPPMGIHPVFSRDGSELFYYDFSKSSIMAAPLGYQPDLKIGTPKPLFSGTYWYGGLGPGGAGGRAWDLDAKTQRFLMLAVGDSESAKPQTPQIKITLNWLEELKRLAPAP